MSGICLSPLSSKLRGAMQLEMECLSVCTYALEPREDRTLLFFSYSSELDSHVGRKVSRKSSREPDEYSGAELFVCERSQSDRSRTVQLFPALKKNSAAKKEAPFLFYISSICNTAT